MPPMPPALHTKNGAGQKRYELGNGEEGYPDA
jgi:hypothetical protein